MYGTGKSWSLLSVHRPYFLIKPQGIWTSENATGWGLGKEEIHTRPLARITEKKMFFFGQTKIIRKFDF